MESAANEEGKVFFLVVRRKVGCFPRRRWWLERGEGIERVAEVQNKNCLMI